MIQYVIKRCLLVIPVLLGATLLIFGIMELTPGDPGRIILGNTASEEEVQRLNEEMGLNKEDYQFYLDLRKYGSVRHAGFGLGFERCVMYLTGMGNIRDVVPFPRTVNNCEL